MTKIPSLPPISKQVAKKINFKTLIRKHDKKVVKNGLFNKLGKLRFYAQLLSFYLKNLIFGKIKM